MIIENTATMLLLFGISYFASSMPLHYIINIIFNNNQLKFIQLNEKILKRLYFFLDIFKGFFLMYLIHNNNFALEGYLKPIYHIFGAMIIIIGYLFPPYFFPVSKEKRRAVSIILGTFMVIFPIDILISSILFFIFYKLTKMIHVTSMLVGLIFPFLIFFNAWNNFALEERFIYTIFGFINAFIMFLVHKNKLKVKKLEE